MVGPGRLRRMIAVQLNHAFALILIGISAGRGSPGPLEISQIGVAQPVTDAAPVAAPAIAVLAELGAPKRIAAVKVAGGSVFAEDASVQDGLAIKLDLQPAALMMQADPMKARHVRWKTRIVAAAADRDVIRRDG